MLNEATHFGSHVNKLGDVPPVWLWSQLSQILLLGRRPSIAFFLIGEFLPAFVCAPRQGQAYVRSRTVSHLVLELVGWGLRKTYSPLSL